MAKISRTRRNATQVEPEPVEGTIFDHFPASQGEQTKQQAKKNDEPSVSDLLARLNDMQSRLDAQDRELARASATVQTQLPPVQIGEEPKLNLEGLPDPVTDAAKYAATIIERGRQYDAQVADYNKRKQDATRPQPMGDPDTLYNDFAELYPEYADKDKQMRFVTGEVAKRLSQRGIDVQRYMYTRPEAFFKDLVNEFNDTFGKPDDDNDEPTEAHVKVQEVRPRRKRQDVDDDDEGRTAGILSQTDRGPTRADAREGKPDGLIEELQAVQRKMGYYA